MLRETEFVVVQNWEGGVRVLNPVPISIGNYFKLILRCATYYPDCDALGFHKISTYPLKQRSKRIIYRTDLGKWRIYLTHTIHSTSTDILFGKAFVPIADRVCFPRSPKTCTIRSENPCMTAGVSTNPSTHCTQPTTLTMSDTRSKLPRWARKRASRLRLNLRAAW